MSRTDKLMRQHEIFDRMSEGDKTRLVMRQNNREVLFELRYIRWVLIVIAWAAFFALGKAWPDWWHLPWWP